MDGEIDSQLQPQLQLQLRLQPHYSTTANAKKYYATVH